MVLKPRKLPMPNMVRIKKLDRRFNGYGVWTHRTEPSYTSRANALVNFVEFRKFLTNVFGPGVHEREAGYLMGRKMEVPKWGYDDYCSIYCRDEAATLVMTSAERFIKEY
jgi:hypothetical protein